MALVLEIIQGRPTVTARSRQFDLTLAEIGSWFEYGECRMEVTLRATPEDVREQYERQLKDLPTTYGETMLEIGAREKPASLL